jgi:FkbM family methyltransferase
VTFRSVLKLLDAAALFIAPGPLVLWLEEKYFRKNGERELFIIEHLCRPDKDAIDVGGNVGCYSLFMRKYARHVFTFEPIPWMAKRLARKFGNTVTVCQMALSSSTGSAQLHIPTLRGTPVTARSSLAAGRDSDGLDITVRMARLDEVYDGQVGLIKIDVEGHEEAVLKGAECTIEQCRPRFLIEMEERYNPGVVDRVTAYFTKQGYSGYFLRYGRIFDIVHFEQGTMQNPDHLKDGNYTNNFIFLPNEDVSGFMDKVNKLGIL